MESALPQGHGGADVFLGLSAAGVLKPELLSEMADTPLILALANPVPEIMPEEARRTVGRGGQGVFGRDTRFRPRFPDPSPFDPRLILRIAPAVAEAAMESGVAGRPISDMDAYADRLNRFVFRSGLIMKPVFLRGGIRLRQAGDLRRWRGRKGFARRPDRHRRRT